MKSTHVYDVSVAASGIYIDSKSCIGSSFPSGYLVGGFNSLEKYEFVNGKDYPIFLMENKKCLKPPTSHYMPSLYPHYIPSTSSLLTLTSPAYPRK
jgi:hypothetical protein